MTKRAHISSRLYGKEMAKPQPKRLWPFALLKGMTIRHGLIVDMQTETIWCEQSPIYQDAEDEQWP